MSTHYTLGEWTLGREGSAWVATHRDGFTTPPVRTLGNLERAVRDGKADKLRRAWLSKVAA